MQVHGKPPNRASQRYGPDRNTTLKRKSTETTLDIQTHQVVLQEVGVVIELHPKRLHTSYIYIYILELSVKRVINGVNANQF